MNGGVSAAPAALRSLRSILVEYGTLPRGDFSFGSARSFAAACKARVIPSASEE